MHRGGVSIASDGPSYINLAPFRAPAYGSLIAFFRLVFGEEIYLSAVIVFQSLLTAFCIWWVVMVIKTVFSPSVPIIAAIYFLFFLTCYSTYLFSPTKAVLSNAIFPEAITIPLWWVMTSLLFYGIVGRRWRDVFLSGILADVAALLRGEKEIYVIAAAVVMVIFAIVLKEGLKRYITIAVYVIVSLLIISLLGRTFAFVLVGSFEPYNAGKKMAATHVLIASDREDAECFSDPNIQTAFLNIMDELEAYGCLRNEIDEAPIARGLAFEKGVDEKIGTLLHDKSTDIVKDEVFHVLELNGVPEKEYNRLANQYYMEMIRTLLPLHVKVWIYNWFSIATVGFIRSIAVVRPGINVMAALLYFLAILLMMICFKRNCRKSGIFMLLVLFYTAANVLSVSLVTFCFSRHMVYGLPLFYSVGLLMLADLAGNRKELTSISEGSASFSGNRRWEDEF